MSDFIRIAARSELPELNCAKEFDCGGKMVCIANVHGRYAAMDNVCQHRGGQLGQGTIEHGKVVCPWHGWRWDPVTGASMENPNMKAAIYELKIEGEDVLIKF